MNNENLTIQSTIKSRFVQFDLQIEDKISWLLKILIVGDSNAVWFW